MMAILLQKWALPLALVLSVFSLQASPLQVEQGVVTFKQGQYFVNERALTGLSLQELRSYEGKSVKLVGEVRTSGELEIYQLLIKQGQDYLAAYDWEALNNEMYDN